MCEFILIVGRFNERLLREHKKKPTKMLLGFTDAAQSELRLPIVTPLSPVHLSKRALVVASRARAWRRAVALVACRSIKDLSRWPHIRASRKVTPPTFPPRTLH